MYMTRRFLILAPVVLACVVTSFAGAADNLSDWNEILAAARKEGRVAVAGPPIKAHRETLQSFQKAYPDIRLELSGLSPDQYEPRVAAERQAGRYLWDVHVGGVSTSIYSQQLSKGWYRPLSPLVRDSIAADANWIGGFKSGFMDIKGLHVFAFGASKSDNIVVNRNIIPAAELKSLNDLLDPRWKGKIALYDPRVRGPGTPPLAQIYKALGAQALRRILVDQEPVLTRTTRQITDWVVRGRYPIAIGINKSSISAMMPEAPQLAAALEQLPVPPDATLLTPAWGGLLALANPPHPNAAVVFINWLLDRQAQTDWAQRSGYNSRRSDVAPGNPALSVSALEWRNGLSLNREDSAKLRMEVDAIAAAALAAR